MGEPRQFYLLLIHLSVIGESAHEGDCGLYLQGKKLCEATNPRTPLRLRRKLYDLNPGNYLIEIPKSSLGRILDVLPTSQLNGNR